MAKVSLLDIVPAEASKETVTIRGQSIDVFGISLAGCVKLLKRFPDMASVLIGQVGEIPPERMVALVPMAATAIIAAGLGHIDEPEYENAAERLGVEEQIDLFAAIMRLTIPSGAGPFVDKLNLLLGVQNPASDAPATPAPVTRSPKQSSTSSPPATDLTTSGDTPTSS